MALVKAKMNDKNQNTNSRVMIKNKNLTLKNLKNHDKKFRN